MPATVEKLGLGMLNNAKEFHRPVTLFSIKKKSKRSSFSEVRMKRVQLSERLSEMDIVQPYKMMLFNLKRQSIEKKLDRRNRRNVFLQWRRRKAKTELVRFELPHTALH